MEFKRRYAIAWCMNLCSAHVISLVIWCDRTPSRCTAAGDNPHEDVVEKGRDRYDFSMWFQIGGEKQLRDMYTLIVSDTGTVVLGLCTNKRYTGLSVSG